MTHPRQHDMKLTGHPGQLDMTSEMMRQLDMTSEMTCTRHPGQLDMTSEMTRQLDMTRLGHPGQLDMTHPRQSNITYQTLLSKKDQGPGAQHFKKNPTAGEKGKHSSKIKIDRMTKRRNKEKRVNMAGTSQLSNLDTENQESKFVHDKEEEQRNEGGGGDSGYSGDLEDEERENDQYWRYISLYTAALKGDWESAKRIFDQDEDAITAYITPTLLTALHIAVGTGKAVDFVEKLVELMPTEALAIRDLTGDTALHYAAAVGNTTAAAILVRKNPRLLPCIKNELYDLPVHIAAASGKRDTLLYLLTVTKDDVVESNPYADKDDVVESNPYADKSGARLLNFVIVSGFYDVALTLVRRYPQLATSTLHNDISPLQAIASKPSAFPSGCRLNFWECLIDYILCQKLHIMHWEFIQFLVPHVKRMKDKKLMHHQALQLVKLLCIEVKSLNDWKAVFLHYRAAILAAARLNIHEVVEEIVEIFPSILWRYNENRHFIFQEAVLQRCENVFNLIYQMSELKEYITSCYDTKGNNLLHLAGQLAPPHKLNLVSGAALQMQRELQWFKEVEKLLSPCMLERENSAGKTPKMVFTEHHKDLVIEGEKWMKDTANSCTIVAALIVTVVFTAAITVPGGNNSDDGRPIFSKERAFIVFAVSDAISLFTSTTSLLIFLSILTSRYSENDFLVVLPNRLIIGLVSLFLSITSMMIAFTTILYLVFALGKAWILIPIVAFTCLPITCFLALQLPLLVDVISSTYCRGVFGKKSDRPFH